MNDTFDLSQTVVVILAGGAGSRLHELSTIEAKPALPLAGRRLVDFACAAAAAAGLTQMHVALPERSGTLAPHLRESWASCFDLSLRDGPQRQETLPSLQQMMEGQEAREIVVMPADQVHALDLLALVRAHRRSDAPATLADRNGEPRAVGPCVLDPSVLNMERAGDLWSDFLPALAEQERLEIWSPPAGTYWRDVDTLDDLRTVSLDLRGEAPLPLPPGGAAGPLGEEEGRDLALEIGGLRLSAPRFGARQRGRWTLLEDSLVLPGARVAPGARLSRAVVAPGAVVPANLSVGDDPAEDTRWFRVTPGGTTLITAPMLARRAAERMRAQLGDRIPGLVAPKA